MSGGGTTPPLPAPGSGPVELAEGEAYPLAEGAGVWRLESGELELFKHERDPDGKPLQPVPLITVFAGELFWGRLPGTLAPYRFEVFACRPSKLSFVPFASVADDPAARRGIWSGLGSWVERISAGCGEGPGGGSPLVTDDRGFSLEDVFTTNPWYSSYYGEESEPVSEGDDVVLEVATGKPTWIEILDGRVEVLGLPEVVAEAGAGPLLLPSRSWVRTVGEVEYRAYTERPPAAVPGPATLVPLQNALLIHAAAQEEEQRGVEAARLQRSQRLQAAEGSRALERLVQVLDRRLLVEEGEDELNRALAVLGRQIGVRFSAPSASESPRASYIEALARASKVRYRKVTMAGPWWREDNGALLTYRYNHETGEELPVVLIPHHRARYGYRIYDPVEGVLRAVTREDLRTFGAIAIFFYRPYPEGAKRLLHLAWFALSGFRREVLFMVFLSTLVSLLGMLTPIAFRFIVDGAIPDGDRALLWQWVLVLFGISLGSAAFSLGQGFLTLRIKTGMTLNMQAAVIDRLLNLPVTFFRRFSSGDMVNRSMILSEISSEVSGIAVKGIFAGLTASVNIFLLLYYNFKLAVIPIVIAFLTSVFTIIISVLLRRHGLAYERRAGKLFGFLIQIVSGITKFRVSGMERLAFNEWSRQYAAQLKDLSAIMRLNNLTTFLNLLLSHLGTLALFYMVMRMTGLGGGPSNQGKSVADISVVMSMGTFLAFNAAFGAFLQGAKTFSNTVTDIIDTLAKKDLCKPIIDEVPEVDELKADPGVLRGQISVQGVSFRYSEDGPYILRGIDIQVRPGQFVAFVGPSGCGKSTLFRLLLGFERPGSGSVLYDQQDLQGLDRSLVRRQVGTVLQSGHIFAGSVLENIASGGVTTLNEAWQAAKDAGLYDDIKAMPMQMNTLVSEGGINLSGGQRQRLLIARALVRNPRLLLFDEATSALDNRTQAIVSQSIERRKVTRLVIAHRLSTIEDADYIYVLDQGRIAERGTYDELAALGGLFSRMIKRQTLES